MSGSTNATTSLRPLLHKLLTSTAVILPIGCYVHENLFTFHKLPSDNDNNNSSRSGSSSTGTRPSNSMEPVLQPGDIVLLRRVDFLPYYRTTTGLNINFESNDHHHQQQQHQQHEEEPSASQKEIDTFDSLLDDETDRLKSLRTDAGVGKPAGGPLTLWRSPLNVIPGDVVVVRSPERFTMDRWDVGRVVGLGGQRVRPFNSHHRIETIPPYRIWIEPNYTIDPPPVHPPSTTTPILSSTEPQQPNGTTTNTNTNITNTISTILHPEQVEHEPSLSLRYGPVSKKLLVGKVERIVWPPKRWGRVERIRPPNGRAWWP